MYDRIYVLYVGEYILQPVLNWIGYDVKGRILPTWHILLIFGEKLEQALQPSTSEWAPAWTSLCFPSLPSRSGAINMVTCEFDDPSSALRKIHFINNQPPFLRLTQRSRIS